jgi:hypothetical protein
MKRIVALLLALASLSAAAQSDIAKFFPAGEQNIDVLVDGYMAPFCEDYGTLVNNGWFTTGATHKKFGFDFGVTVTTIKVESDVKRFMPAGLTGVSFLGSTAQNNDTPTFYGPEDEFPMFEITSGNNADITFEGPDGADVESAIKAGSMAVATVYGGIGLFKNTDLRFRYTPTLSFDNVEYNNWGIALLHDVKQHIPGISELPFSLSFLAGYTQAKAVADLSGFYTGSGQEGVAVANAFTFQLIISKSLKIIDFYGSIGYNTSSATYEINGTYNVNETDSGYPLNESFTLTNPYSDSFSSNGMRFTGGIRFKLGPVILNGDYTFYGKQQLLTVGFGFTFR